jgi:hypothetical protein
VVSQPVVDKAKQRFLLLLLAVELLVVRHKVFDHKHGQSNVCVERLHPFEADQLVQPEGKPDYVNQRRNRMSPDGCKLSRGLALEGVMGYSFGTNFVRGENNAFLPQSGVVLDRPPGPRDSAMKKKYT